jgi:hypothetical protein
MKNIVLILILVLVSSQINGQDTDVKGYTLRLIGQ